MELGDELRKLRQRCFLSQEAFAKSLKVSVSTINRWETDIVCHERHKRILP